MNSILTFISKIIKNAKSFLIRTLYKMLFN